MVGAAVAAFANGSANGSANSNSTTASTAASTVWPVANNVSTNGAFGGAENAVPFTQQVPLGLQGRTATFWVASLLVWTVSTVIIIVLRALLSVSGH